MNLREALDLCTDVHVDDWVDMPGGEGGRPATAMVAGMFDPGFEDARTRPLAGHSIAVYEPDARLALVWPLPDDDRYLEHPGDRYVPEWAENDAHTWKNARVGWAVVVLAGAPIWQAPVQYLDWGSGIGGYVADFRPILGDYDKELGAGARKIEGWEVSAWEVGLANLINSFSHTAADFARIDPTSRLVTSPYTLHPIDARRARY